MYDYRKYLNEVMQDWRKNGKLSNEMKNDVRARAQKIDQKLGTISSKPKVEIKGTVADVIAPKPPGSVDFTPTLNWLWGWFLASLPGKRYQKLLTRAVAAESDYIGLDRRVKTVWNAG